MKIGLVMLSVILHAYAVPCGKMQTEQLHLQSPPRARARAAQTATVTGPSGAPPLPVLSEFSKPLNLWTSRGHTALL